MGSEKEVTIIEKEAAEREQALGSLIERLGQETGGIHHPETPFSDILNLPQHETQTSSGIQILNNQKIVNKNGNGYPAPRPSPDDSRPWWQIAKQRFAKILKRR
jgi:hypothetical protein